jgi:hypothetical protein
MAPLWVGIHPQLQSTRILAMAGAEIVLKARLQSSPSSRLALPTLLEALALWQGIPVRAALVADSKAPMCGTSLYRDSFPDFGSALYTLDFVDALRKPRRRDELGGMGPFADLRQLLLFEGAHDRR